MATTCSAAAAAVLGGVSRPASGGSAAALPLTRCSLLPLASSSQPRLKIAGSRRFSSFQVRASSDDAPGTFNSEEFFQDLKEKWDNLENKSNVVLYGGGAVVAVWLSSVVVGAINSVPVLPKIMELVGLGYTGWFVYRYLLFKSSRKELAEDIETLKKKIGGTE